MIKRISIAIVVSFIIVLSLYFIMFHDGLSEKASSWSEFGGYLSGVLMPILTTINIYVFLKLTNAISEKDIAQSEKEMENQRQIVLMQFRKAEIDSFLRTIDDALVPKIKTNYLEIIEPMAYAVNYLDTFLKTKLIMFNLDEKSETAVDILKLDQAIKQIYSKMKGNNRIESSDVITILKLRDAIIISMQKITLSMK